MNPNQKRFVKYTFQQKSNNRLPREPYKQKQKQKSTQKRNKRYISYTQKSNVKANVLKDMINSYTIIKKPSKQILQICKVHPKYFNITPKQPESFTNQLLNVFLITQHKKPAYQSKNFTPLECQSQQQPNWDSNSDHDGCIQSKKIDSELIQKISQKLGNIKPIRNTDLKRHEKQFLQDFYREKHLQQLQRQEKQKEQNQKNKKNQIDNQWSQYQEKQVQDFVNMGFIQKIDQNEDQMNSGSDFSVQDQKSQKQASQKSQSSQQQDDVFGDVGPSTIIKKQQTHQQSETSKLNQERNQFQHGTVLISSHVFTRIAQQVGIPPGACIWIIKNKNQRYKVTTQFMDQMYRLNNFCQSLPYISLNHSQFVHNNDVEKQKGLATFKNYNARKHQYNNYYKNYRENKNQDNKKKFLSKNHKTHINKK